MNLFRNHEGYPDPTAGAAMANILKEERAERRRSAKTGAGNKPVPTVTDKRPGAKAYGTPSNAR